MRKATILMSAIAALFVVGLILTPVSPAQEAVTGGGPQTGWTMEVPLVIVQQALLDNVKLAAKPIVSISGAVKKIEAPKAYKDTLVMIVKTEDAGSYNILMGPKWFVLNQQLKVNVGDTVEIRGIEYKAGSMIASEVSKGDFTMVLRSESDGTPNWVCCIPRVRK